MFSLLRRYRINMSNSSISKSMQRPRYNSDGTHNYEAAIDALNMLQSNAQYLRNRQAETANSTHDTIKANCIGKMHTFLNRSNIHINKLKSVIHVAGTKGKGSTCALCESILRHHGLKTGFYSSPHLINVTERVKIDGKPIESNVFAKYFWDIYRDLVKSKDEMMPIYFQMLTLVAFKIFVEENVDVAIIEVGIGGEYDSTNVVKHSDVVGISSLGLDHTSILGSTIEKISWHKAGIMKSGCKAFTVSQKKEAMQVLESRSKEINCDLEVVHPISGIPVQHGMPDEIYLSNASLAARISETWLNMHNIELSTLKLNEGLQNCRWPGRFQVIRFPNINFYIDGAHTAESLEFCAKWFIEKQVQTTAQKGLPSGAHNANDVKRIYQAHRVLLFNSTGDRDVEGHLQILRQCNFQRVYFVPNVCQSSANSLDNINHNFPESEQLLKCMTNKRKWCELFPHDAGKSHVMPSVSAAFEHLMVTNNNHEVLITGSLHLVGSALQALGNFNTHVANAVQIN